MIIMYELRHASAKITRQEVALVEARLGNEYSVYFANKFSSPFIPDVIGQMEADGIEQCICLILEPHYSFYSVMGYEKFLESKQIQFLVIMTGIRKKRS